MKEKIIAVLTQIYGSVENALQSICSKRAYVIALLAWLAISELDRVKFVGLCVVGCFYIWSEVKRKESSAVGSSAGSVSDKNKGSGSTGGAISTGG